MVRTISDERWEGFKPQEYFVGKRVWECPATEVVRDKDGNQKAVSTTLLEIFNRTNKPKIIGVEWEKDVTILTDTGSVVIEGRPFDGQFLKLILTLQQEGLEMFELQWYPYTSDVCLDFGGQGAFQFFIVHKDKIVREQVVLFYDDYHDKLDPSLLETHENNERLWRDERHIVTARNRYWYRQFYTTTMAGQMMVLRPDEPDLFHYERDQPDPLLAGNASIAMLLNKVRRLVWFVIVLLAVVVGLMLRR